MTLKQQIEADIKTAMLAGKREQVDVLRDLKSAVQYEEVAQKKREAGLSDSEIEQVIMHESKKRDEAAELYEKGGNLEAASKERREKQLLSNYLPQQLNDDELAEVVRMAIVEAGGDAHAGKLIGAIKSRVGNRAEGARVAAAVQKALQ